MRNKIDVPPSAPTRAAVFRSASLIDVVIVAEIDPWRDVFACEVVDVIVHRGVCKSMYVDLLGGEVYSGSGSLASPARRVSERGDFVRPPTSTDGITPPPRTDGWTMMLRC
jgi:hypothetical protein